MTTPRLTLAGEGTEATPPRTANVVELLDTTTEVQRTLRGLEYLINSTCDGMSEGNQLCAVEFVAQVLSEQAEAIERVHDTLAELNNEYGRAPIHP